MTEPTGGYFYLLWLLQGYNSTVYAAQVSLYLLTVKLVSLTNHTSRHLRENRAPGEHVGPCLKLHTVVSVNSFFPQWSVVKASHPLCTIYIYFLQRRQTSTDYCIMGMCFRSSYPTPTPPSIATVQGSATEWSCDSKTSSWAKKYLQSNIVIHSYKH